MNICTIACELHDYIEIACLYRYEVQLTLHTQQLVFGTALDINTLNQREYLVLDNPEHPRIDLLDIQQVTVLTPNAKFTSINLNQNDNAV